MIFKIIKSVFILYHNTNSNGVANIKLFYFAIMRKYINLILFFLLNAVAIAQTINPGSPELSPTRFKLDSLPVSEINIPISINLKPIYQMAEKNVDTVFTSPNYPDDWVYDGCDTRDRKSVV